ncbi:transcription termination factor MTERF15, mitochondrial [Trifolium repens]|nr:transcription termination factor MTERF15, mitochondrial [Trifolium repens]
MFMMIMIHQSFSSSSSYSSISPFFPLQIKSKSFHMFNTPSPYFFLNNNFTFPLLYPSQSSLHFCTNISDDYSTSFEVSYLINNFEFSPQFASKLCSTYKVRFKTSENPDYVLNFFRNNGFSDTQLRNIISKAPKLLSCDPSKRVLPKFQFLLSKGASKSDIVKLVSKNPMILSPSLENHIVPTYELLYRFLQSDKDIITGAIHNPALLSDHLVPQNITMLIKNGLTDSSIARLFRTRSRSLNTNTRCMLKLVEELKDLGFNPSKITFGIALEAKLTVNKTLWKEKVDAFKKWGWSDEDVIQAFRRQPHCMLVSVDKINSVLSFWVNQLGWDSLALAIGPSVFSNSLEKRIIPRASVVQFLLKKGLRNKNASLTYPFVVPEKLFLNAFIMRFKEESSYLLKLYEEKLSPAQTSDKIGMS